MNQGSPGITPREARLLTWVQTQKDYPFPPGSQWPSYALKKWLNPVKSDKERFEVFYFLWYNGMDPESAHAWTNMLDVREGRVIWRHLTTRQLEHMDSLVVRAKKGTGVFDGKTRRVIDLEKGYVPIPQ